MTVKVEFLLPSERPRGLSETETYKVTKSRGKLTLEDIEDAFKEYGVEGYVSIVLKISENDYSGWDDDETPKGDMVYATVIDEGLNCPICGQLTPLIRYCPECGACIDLLNKEGKE
ncbi:MAG: hypothetical protein IJV02_00165 [Candidatus Methanomethylophilaceae archaeon]|nr:hypothetical protein [Candidatus Methanomethylophilaceae archaeon]